MSTMNLTERTITALKAAGLDARKPANYPGTCKAAYIVVQDGGTKDLRRATCRRLVTLYLYVPYDRPQLLHDLAAAARAAMNGVSALTMTETGAETVDDAYKAIFTSLTYSALCAK